MRLFLVIFKHCGLGSSARFFLKNHASTFSERNQSNHSKVIKILRLLYRSICKYFSFFKIWILYTLKFSRFQFRLLIVPHAFADCPVLVPHWLLILWGDFLHSMSRWRFWLKSSIVCTWQHAKFAWIPIRFSLWFQPFPQRIFRGFFLLIHQKWWSTKKKD